MRKFLIVKMLGLEAERFQMFGEVLQNFLAYAKAEIAR